MTNETENKIWKAYAEFFKANNIGRVQQRENETIVTIKFRNMPHEDHIEWAASVIEGTIKDRVIRAHKYWNGSTAIVVATVEASGSLEWAEKIERRGAEAKKRFQERLAERRYNQLMGK